MSQIKKLNQTSCAKITTAILAALQPLEEGFGLKFTDSGGKFSESIFTLKVECALVNENGEAVSKAIEDFKRYAKIDHPCLEGLTIEDLDVEFELAGHGKCLIAGLRPRASKNNIFIQPLSGAPDRVAPASMVKMCIRRAKGGF